MAANGIVRIGRGLEPTPGSQPGRTNGPEIPRRHRDHRKTRMTGPGARAGVADRVAGTARVVEGPLPPDAAPHPGPRASHGDRMKGQVVVLLPALNEVSAIGQVIDRIPVAGLRSRGYDVAVWVVDGQSTDGTMDVARARGASTFVQTGRGKGNGMRQALDSLLDRTRPGVTNDRVFVMLEADGTSPAEEIPRFIEALESGEDVVLGSRLSGSIADGAISDMNRLGNRILSALASLLFRVRVTDVCTGMWGFREDALRRFGLVAQGFDLEADLFAAVCERRARLRELPSFFKGRVGGPKPWPLRPGGLRPSSLLRRRVRPPTAEPR